MLAFAPTEKCNYNYEANLAICRSVITGAKNSNAKIFLRLPMLGDEMGVGKCSTPWG